MKLIPNQLGGTHCGWHSDDAAQLYWYRRTDPMFTDLPLEAPETLQAHVIGSTGIERAPFLTITIADLKFLGAGLFGEARLAWRNPKSGSETKWTGKSYKYGFYADYERSTRGEHVIIRQDGGGIYVYLDAGNTDWPQLCWDLPPERLWDLGQVICHTYEQGRKHERARLYHLLAENRLKRSKIRGRNAYRIEEISATPAETTDTIHAVLRSHN